MKSVIYLSVSVLFAVKTSTRAEKGSKAAEILESNQEEI